MGGGGSKEKSSSGEEKIKSPATPKVNKSRKQKKANVKQQFQVPLFGCAGAGKSTVFKALRIAKLSGFDEHERIVYGKKMKRAIMQMLSSMLEKIPAESLDGCTEQDVAQITRLASIEDLDAEEFDSGDILGIAKRFVSGKMIKDILSSSELTTSSLHLMDNAENMCTPSYKATDADILRFREPTRTKDFLVYDINDTATMIIHDFGGHRHLRDTWQKFADENKENVKLIIMVVALDSYLEDVGGMNDATQNKMKEAFFLLNMLINNIYKGADAAVFLNKVDLFQGALDKNCDLEACLGGGEYTGGANVTAAREYIVNYGKHQCGEKYDCVQFHNICGIDVEIVEKIVHGVEQSLVKSVLSSMGFI